MENFDIWQHKYHSAGSAEALMASLLETLPPVDVDRIMNWRKNDSIRGVFTGSSQWEQIKSFHQGLPSSYDGFVGEVQPGDGCPPNPSMAWFRFQANFPSFLEDRLFGIDSKGKLTICWQVVRELSIQILDVGYDINQAVADIMFMNSAMSTNLCVIEAESTLLSKYATKPIYDYIQSGTEPIMTDLELKMTTLFPGLRSAVILGKNPRAAQLRMMEKHSELQSLQGSMYVQDKQLTHMTPLATGWADSEDVGSFVDVLSEVFCSLLGVPYHQFTEAEVKTMYNFSKNSVLTSISREKARDLIETAIQELEVTDKAAALQLKTSTQSAFAEQAISNMSRQEAIGFKLSLQHAIDNNLEHTIAERRCHY